MVIMTDAERFERNWSEVGTYLYLPIAQVVSIRWRGMGYDTRIITRAGAEWYRVDKRKVAP